MTAKIFPMTKMWTILAIVGLWVLVANSGKSVAAPVSVAVPGTPTPGTSQSTEPEEPPQTDSGGLPPEPPTSQTTSTPPTATGAPTSAQTDPGGNPAPPVTAPPTGSANSGQLVAPFAEFFNLAVPLADFADDKLVATKDQYTQLAVMYGYMLERQAQYQAQVKAGTWEANHTVALRLVSTGDVESVYQAEALDPWIGPAMLSDDGKANDGGGGYARMGYVPLTVGNIWTWIFTGGYTAGTLGNPLFHLADTPANIAKYKGVFAAQQAQGAAIYARVLAANQTKLKVSAPIFFQALAANGGVI